MIRNPVAVDISHYDQVESFHDVKESGIQICVAKCTQGDFSIDPTYKENTRRAKMVNLLAGSYHFGTNSNGITQAQYFLKNCVGKTIMVLDYERYPKSQMPISECESFIKYISKTTGKYPVLYYGELLIEQERKGLIAPDSVIRKCSGWVANYTLSPIENKIKNMDLVLQQYTGDGVGNLPHSIKGIVGNAVDLSVWIGNQEDIPYWSGKHSL